MLKDRKAKYFVVLKIRRGGEREIEIKEAEGKGTGDNFKHFFNTTDS